MKRIFLFLITLVSFASSAINECKTDVYFGNGILTEKEDAKKNAKLLDEAIKQKFGLPYYKKHIGNVTYVYNSTWDRSHDLLETYLQLDREDPKFFEKLITPPKNNLNIKPHIVPKGAGSSRPPVQGLFVMLP